MDGLSVFAKPIFLPTREMMGFARKRALNPSYLVAFSRNLTSAARSSAEPIVCSGILVPGV
jgi:hypothetical protein